MASRRIEFLATAPSTDPTSGLSRTVWELGRALGARGHTVRILYPGDDAPGPAEVDGVTGVPLRIDRVGRGPFARDLAVAKAASRLLDPEDDIIIGNDEKAGALDLPRGRRSGRPVFGMFFHDVALHTFDTLRPLEPDRGLRQSIGNWLDRRTLKRLETTAAKRARVILVASELNRRLLTDYYRIPTNLVQLLPLGIPDPVDVGSKEAARLALHVPADVPVVAFVGRTPERQGLATALDAFRRVRGFFPGARFLVVGSRVATEPGVVSLGVVDERTKACALRAADVFVFPARYEGFGLAPREAMRYGVPAVVSRAVPFDGLPSEEAVRVVASDDPGDFAADLAELLADPALRRKLGEAGRRYADEYSYPKMAERFERLFEPYLAN